MKIKVFTARGSKGLQVRLARISGGAVGAAARPCSENGLPNTTDSKADEEVGS